GRGGEGRRGRPCATASRGRGATRDSRSLGYAPSGVRRSVETTVVVFIFGKKKSPPGRKVLRAKRMCAYVRSGDAPATLAAPGPGPDPRGRSHLHEGTRRVPFPSTSRRLAFRRWHGP